MWKKLTSHKNVMYSRFPRIKSFIHKGFFVVGLIGFFNRGIYYKGHYIGIERANTGALMIDWNRLKKTGYDNIIQ